MRRSLFLTINSAAAAGLIGLATSPALADASPAILAAFVTTMNQPSYHMTMASKGTDTTETDFVKPDKMHILSRDVDSIVIGSTMYVKMSGKWTKMDAKGLWSDPLDGVKQMQTHHADYTSADLGTLTAGGVSYHAYRMMDTKKHLSQTVFIDAAGRIGRIEISGISVIVITFSKYGEAFSIVPPM